MESSRQFLRFSVPGLLFILTALTAQAAFRIAWGEPVAQAVEGLGAAPAVVLLGAAVPIGLIVYQMYYASYRPVRLAGHLATSDRGAEVLMHLTCDQRAHLAYSLGRPLDARIATQKATATLRTEGGKLRLALAYALDHFPLRHLGWLVVTEWRDQPCPAGVSDCSCLPPTDSSPSEAKEAYENRWNHNWDAIMVALDELAGPTASAEIKNEYTGKSDTYHALGASRTAVGAGTLLVLVYNAGLNTDVAAAHPLATGLAALIIALTSTAIGLVLHQTRRQTQKSMLARLKLSLRANLPPDGRPGRFLGLDQTSADEASRYLKAGLPGSAY